MTFRINFYPEFAEKRARARRRAAFMAGAAGLLTVELLLVIWIGLSGYLLRERVAGLEAEVMRLEARVQASEAPPPELLDKNKMATIRRTRIDWAPKLSALSCLLDRSLMLVELRGTSPGRGTKGKIELDGRVLTRDSSGDAVAGLVERIRNDPRVIDAFPVITLGRLEGSSSGQFHIVCEPEESGS